MRVAWLEIQNFRSIKWLRLEGLDKPQVVLEGPNDVGKSNILHAMDLVFSALPSRLRMGAALDKPIPGEPPIRPHWVKSMAELFRHGEDSFTINIGLRFASEDGTRGWKPDPTQVVEFGLRWRRDNADPVLEKSSIPFLKATGLPIVSVGSASQESKQMLEAIAVALAPAFRLVSTERAPRRETIHLNRDVPLENLVRWQGQNLKQMLFLYKNSPEVEIQERFEQLREAVRDPELEVGIMNVSVSPDETINVRTRYQGVERDLQERGSGIQQLLTLLTLSLCHRGKILAIEEPEMNLSEPNQRRLWKKLREFSAPGGPLDQVFVTSHSRVFEEEAERIIVTRNAELGTQTKWAEPAPARRMRNTNYSSSPVAGGSQCQRRCSHAWASKRESTSTSYQLTTATNSWALRAMRIFSGRRTRMPVPLADLPPVPPELVHIGGVLSADVRDTAILGG